MTDEARNGVFGVRKMKATIDPEGRICLAVEMQTQLGVQPGDDVLLEKHGNEWIIRAAQPPTGLSQEGNVLVHRGISNAQGDDPLANSRDERFERLREGLTQ
jgi:hypothetical protein